MKLTQQNTLELPSITHYHGTVILTSWLRRQTIPQPSYIVRRNLSSCPADVKSTCYKTLVRPQLEYAATVWGPWTQTNISKIEAVQQRAACFTLSDYRRTSSVSSNSMLHQLKWDDLITRRHQSKVTMIYRVIHQLVAIPSAPYLQPTVVRTRGNDMRFLVPFTSVNSYKRTPSSRLPSDSGTVFHQILQECNP